MANSNNDATMIGMFPKIARPGHREDYIVRVLKPSKKFPVPKVELKVYVNNTNTNPPFVGLSGKGGYFLLTLAQYEQLVAMRDKVAEAVRAVMPVEGEALQADVVPDAPDLALLGVASG